ncbi:hypothetical protein [Nocardia jejuensis]|uniref:hypothetical protein n=1 Tax=Nocardia jejuensis TaxID=328049 RepID=UPI0012FB218E|nr:hypothetical protein [Nocardia jejuensis]
MSPKRRVRMAFGAAALVAVAVLGTACNGDKGNPVAATTSAGQPDGAQQQNGGGQQKDKQKQSTVRTIGKTGWYEGFEITVDKATVVPDEFGGGKLTVDITYKNTRLDNATMSNNTYLQVGGQVDGGASFDSPEVPGKGSATGKVTTPIRALEDANHWLDTVTVLYGQSSDNQTKIPLSASGKVESVQPRSVNVTGTLTQDQTTIEITGATLTPSYTKNELGKMELALHVKIIGGSGISDGGSNIYYDWFSIKTPAGQLVTADTRGPINELLNRNETIDNPKNEAIFVVPSPGTGQYVLTYNALKDAGAASAPTLNFTVS